MKNVLLTGASDAASARVFQVLARSQGALRIYVLPGGQGSATPSAEGKNKEVVSLPGDVKLPRLGLDERAFDDLCAGVDTIFHCAERPALDQDLEAARSENLTPVRTLIEVLEKAPSTRLVHLSTTWVSGTKRGLFTELDLACDQGFYNAYEQSKHEAECLLRGSSVSGRVTIVRRSSAAGGSQGPDPSGAVTIDSLLHALRGGPPTLIAGDPRARVDIIPVDYLADGMVALAGQPGAGGRTYHLIAGWERSLTLRALFDAVRAHGRSGKILFLPSLLASTARALSTVTGGRLSSLPGRSRSLEPYLRQRCVFDDFMARTLLEPLGISCPPLDAYMGRVLDAARA